MKKIFSFIVITTVLLGTILPGSVLAEGLSEVKDRINDLENQKDDILKESGNIDAEKSTTEEKIEENKNQQVQVTNELTQIESNLEETKNSIAAKEKEINQTNEEIDQTTEDIEQLKLDITDLKDRIAKREELLKNRLRSIQQSGGNVSYLEVLMGAKNFADFINRATAVTKIMDQDKDIMETHVAEKQELETKQTSLEDKQTSLVAKKQGLEDQKEELVSLKAQLDNQMAERERLMAQLQVQHEELIDYQLTLEEEQELLRKEKIALEKAIKLAQDEKKRLEQLAAEQKKNNNTSSPGPTAAGGELFGMPAATSYVSSNFNPNRMHPIYHVPRPHTGIDFASGGTVPIYAAATGVVSTVYYNHSAYGNAVFISHYINGKSYTTLYAHMRNGSVSVSEGDTVTRGQQIGLMGSTGDSTGQHLHFEIRVGSNSRSNAVNPRPYLFP